jgi:hypothetical protein
MTGKFFPWHVFSGTVFIVFVTIVLNWLQKFLTPQPLPSLSAGLGGIAGILLLEHICLPLLGKLGTILIVSSLLRLEIFLDGNALLGGFINQTFRYFYLFFKSIHKMFRRDSPKHQNASEPFDLKVTPKVHEFETTISDKTSSDKLLDIQIFEEIRIDKTNTTLTKRDSGHIFSRDRFVKSP